LRKLALLDLGRGYRARGLSLPSELTGLTAAISCETRLHVGAAASKPNRHQRQRRDMRQAARAKQLDDTGHGYSLTRNKVLI
jgi:hypothetical protein